jgi:hypothetical protein
MSENGNKNKGEGGFWNTLNGTIAGIAGMIAAIGGLIVAVSSLKLPSQPNSYEQSQSEGTFEVLADKENGFKFQLQNKEPVKITLTASGEWRLDSGNGLSYFSAAGKNINIDMKDKLKCPNERLGALVYIQNGKCYYAGDHKPSLTLQPKEEIHFYMNDIEKGYDDNEGTIKVRWRIVN